MSKTNGAGSNPASAPDAEAIRIGAILTRQLDLLARLSGSLSPARAANPADEITRLEQRTRDQGEMLAEWMQLEGALGPDARRAGPSLDRRPQFRDLLVQIRGKCDFELAVLRRARRTAAALSSLLSVQDPTYTPAALGMTSVLGPFTGAPPEVRERPARE